MMNFSDRYGPWALIAGASEGTGRAYARQVAAQGVNCILIARREGPLTALAEEIRAASGVECVTAAIDLAAPDASGSVVAAVGKREVGLFISNAGSDPHGMRFLDRESGDWAELVQRNVMTMMRCCHHFAQPMRDRGKGGLLLVNSGACYGGAPHMAAYSASKAFTLCFAESLWGELRSDGVHVLTLVMHMTDTPEFRRFLAAKRLPVPDGIADPEKVAALGLERLPFGPIQNWGLKDDEAGYAVLSASDRRKRVLAIEAASTHVFGEART
jgi:short-subunit dehydrogenase